MRHAAVIQRASTLLRKDSAKLETFRNQISAYRNSSLSASELIDGFFTLFDGASNAELGTVIKELADLFEAAPTDKAPTDHRAALLRAWHDWKAINEDYPTLPGAQPSSSAAAPPRWALPSTPSAPPPSARVLRLKSSTARSGRAAAGRSATWGSAAAPRAPAAAALPPSTPWAAPAAARAPPRNPAPLADDDAFPSLPAAPRPAGGAWGAVRRGGSAVGAAWGAQGRERQADGPAVEQGELGGKRKVKQGKRITVMHFG